RLARGIGVRRLERLHVGSHVLDGDPACRRVDVVVGALGERERGAGAVGDHEVRYTRVGEVDLVTHGNGGAQRFRTCGATGSGGDRAAQHHGEVVRVQAVQRGVDGHALADVEVDDLDVLAAVALDVLDLLGGELGRQRTHVTDLAPRARHAGAGVELGHGDTALAIE